MCSRFFSLLNCSHRPNVNCVDSRIISILCEIGSPNAGCFNLEREFQDYASNAPWTGKRLGHLLNNVTRVNGALMEAKKMKEKKKTSTPARIKRVPKSVPYTSKLSHRGT